MDKTKVAIAMSGGVDSSVAAALLKNQGYEVIGLTMCFGLKDAPHKKPSCCGWQGVEDARRVAHALGIKHYVINMHTQLEEHVIKDFCLEYQRGRTPNPCVRCNQFLKFGYLLNRARAIGAQYLATGHYVKKVKGKSKKEKVFLLKKAKDKKKDQSYFLYRLSQRQLKHTLFPLGDYTKEEVRALAKKFGLPVADKAASQEICFLDKDYRDFLQKRLGLKQRPGDVVDCGGRVIGRHQGIACYTVGQREGLGIALGYPAYVTEIDAKNNLVRLSRIEDAYERGCLVRKLNLISQTFKKRVALRVKIRYNHKEARAAIILHKGFAEVRFLKPQFAITPGQSAVFYDLDKVVGGGIIEKRLSNA